MRRNRSLIGLAGAVLGATVLGATVFGACNGGDAPDTTIIGEPPAGPTVEHTPPDAPLRDGDVVVITARAEDPNGVAQVVLRHRVIGAPAFDALELTEVAPGEWQGEVTVRPPGLAYWFRAVDASPFAAETVYPANAATDAFTLPVDVVGRALPWHEDFDGGVTFQQAGFGVASIGFPGYGWRLSASRSVSGASAANHPAAPAGGTPFDDWLVLPPLDLTSLDNVELTFQERGTGVDQAAHEVWVSTGSADPASGDFSLVMPLSPPIEGAWGRSDLVDLSPWTGEPAVFVALRAVGRTDSWWVDDLRVGPLGLDLVLRQWSVDATDPGGQTSVSLEFGNRGGNSDGDTVFRGEIDAADGAFSAPVNVGTFRSGQIEQVALTLGVAATAPDDAPLPFVVVGEDDARVFAWDLDVTVGDPPRAIVDFTTDANGLTQLWVGAGPVDAPVHETRVYAAVAPAGSQQVVVDLLPFTASLPPGPAERRWFARLETLAGGQLASLRVLGGGAESGVSEPVAIEPGGQGTLFLPMPPDLIVTDSAISPSLAPGLTSDWQFTLSNQGNATTGAATISLVSRDDDLVVTSDPVTLEVGLLNGQSIPWQAQLIVDSSRIDGRPLRAAVVVTDEVETVELPVSLPMPWAQLLVTQVTIREDDNGDGRLDPGETARLELVLRNVGTASTVGVLPCVLQSVAPIEVVADTAWLVPVGVGQARVEDAWRVRANGGSPGDVVQLPLVCGSGPTRTESRVTLTLSALGEVPLGGIIDPIGDSDGPDLLTVSAAHDGFALVLRANFVGEVQVDGQATIDGLLHEVLITSAGAPYDLYHVSFVGSAGTVRGRGAYGVWASLGGASAALLAPDLLEVRVPTAPLGLAQPSISLGVGVGFCGGTAFYCDQLPDGFGNLAQGTLDTSGFVRFSW